MSDGAIPGKGWTPDPGGRHEYRFWDGSAWTDHVSDSGVQSVDPLAPPAPPASEPPPRNISRKMLASIVLVLVLVLGGIGAYLWLKPGNKIRIGLFTALDDNSALESGDTCASDDIQVPTEFPSNVGVRTTNGTKYTVSTSIGGIWPSGLIEGEVALLDGTTGCMFQYVVDDVPNSEAYDFIFERFPGDGGAEVEVASEVPISELEGNLWYTTLWVQ